MIRHNWPLRVYLDLIGIWSDFHSVSSILNRALILDLVKIYSIKTPRCEQAQGQSLLYLRSSRSTRSRIFTTPDFTPFPNTSPRRFMSDVPVTEAHLLGLFFASILYGLHLTTYGFCSASRFFSSTRPGKNWPMFAVSTLLLVNGSFDLFVHFHQIIRAFVFSDAVGGPVAVYNNISNWENVAKSLSVILQTMIGDAMLVCYNSFTPTTIAVPSLINTSSQIYRCWIVYGKSWRAVFVSVVLWLGCIAATICHIVAEVTLHSKALITSRETRPSAVAFWGLKIRIALLIRRIWKVERMNQVNIISNDYTTRSRNVLRKVMLIMIESGFLYSSSSFMNFITLLCKSNAIYVTTGIETHMAAISFNLVLIRVSRLGEDEGSLPSRAISFARSRLTQFEPPLSSQGSVEAASDGSIKAQ
ncbi:hypothetical protein D9613_001292 [Agrocybe pediades]|uniref:Uncharacterized protein n=1 Tax=Agrocybe pediades TaxID=84607 RepID=A0A8H4VV08_9AGAR|nr:hypothetical protein D9613_001292 [Agrocybe pediades]